MSRGAEQCADCGEVCHPCDTLDFDLQMGFYTGSGLPVYVDRSVNLTDPSYATLPPLAETFASVLLFVAATISASVPPALHIFFEPPHTPTGLSRREVLGFNTEGALFFSLRAFASVHASLPSVWMPECTAFWLVVMSHELAHNLVSEHDARHEDLMEGMLIHVLPALVRQHVQQAQAQAGQQRSQLYGGGVGGGGGGGGGGGNALHHGLHHEQQHRVQSQRARETGRHGYGGPR